MGTSDSSAPLRPPTKRILSSSNIEREEPTPIAEPESPAPSQGQVAATVATTVPESASLKSKKSSSKIERSGGLISAKLAELVVYCKGRRFAGLDCGPGENSIFFWTIRIIGYPCLTDCFDQNFTSSTKSVLYRKTNQQPSSRDSVKSILSITSGF